MNITVKKYVAFWPVAHEMLIRDILSGVSSGGHFVLRCKIAFAILVEGIIGNIYVKCCYFGPVAYELLSKDK